MPSCGFVSDGARRENALEDIYLYLSINRSVDLSIYLRISIYLSIVISLCIYVDIYLYPSISIYLYLYAPARPSRKDVMQDCIE